MRELFILCVATLALACWTDCDCSGEGCCSQFGWCGVGPEWCQGRTPDHSNCVGGLGVFIGICVFVVAIGICACCATAYYGRGSQRVVTEDSPQAVELLAEDPTPRDSTSSPPPAQTATEDPTPRSSPHLEPVELLTEDDTPPASPYWLEEV